MELFFIREGWVITICVLLYVILAAELCKDNVYMRLVVPLVISLALHTIRFFTRADVDLIKYVSDIFYDYFAPIGVYRFVALLKDYRARNKKKGESK